VPTLHLSSDQDDSQHPFGNQASTSCKFVALGFASQPFDWFAFSRMMTLQARLTRNYASAHVGQALHLTIDECCQAKSLTYGSEDEFRAARDLAITCPGPTSVRHASTTNLCQLASKSNEGLETKRKYSARAEPTRVSFAQLSQSVAKSVRLIQTRLSLRRRQPIGPRQRRCGSLQATRRTRRRRRFDLRTHRFRT
jgi:hypothetical protein